MRSWCLGAGMHRWRCGELLFCLAGWSLVNFASWLAAWNGLSDWMVARMAVFCVNVMMVDLNILNIHFSTNGNHRSKIQPRVKSPKAVYHPNIMKCNLTPLCSSGTMKSRGCYCPPVLFPLTSCFGGIQGRHSPLRDRSRLY